MEKGLVQVYCGDGKGKTTAAIGLAVRQIAVNNKILFVSFLKNGNSSEVSVLEKFDNVDTIFDKKLNKFIFYMNDIEKKEAKENQRDLFEYVKNNSNKYDCVIMDEVLDLITNDFITETELVDFINNKPENTELVITGHSITDKIIEAVDYYTNFKCIKHPYEKGIKARKGIEF